MLPTPIDFGVVERVALSGRGPREGLNELLTACSSRFPHAAWQTLRTLDIEPDAVALQHWLAQLLEREPIPRKIKGLYFGLSEHADDDGDGQSAACTSREAPSSIYETWTASGLSSRPTGRVVRLPIPAS